MKKLLSVGLLIILLIICSISLICYLHFTNKLDIDKIVLKKQDSFKISNVTYEFNLDQLRNKAYNVVLKYLTNNETDAIALRERRDTPGKYNIVVHIRDKKGNIIQGATISGGSKFHSGWSQDYEEWFLITFLAKASHSYKLQITFWSDDDFFDKLTKEIYVEQDYDPAALPWWDLFRTASLVIFVVTLAGVAVNLFIMKRYQDRIKGGDVGNAFRK